MALSVSFKVLIVLLFSMTAMAQSTAGRLLGTVYDQTGLVVADARVVVRDVNTLNARRVTTDSEGRFTVPLLDAGAYAVTIAKEGFSDFRKERVNIEVGREYKISVYLQISQIKAELNVTVNPLSTGTTTAEVVSTVSSEQILNLPLNARNPLSLLLLQAGTASSKNLSTIINGQRTSFTNITRDGINIQDPFVRTNATDFAPGRPSLDDSHEFTIVTQNAGADQGYGAAQIRFVTPKGSSRYHGGLWEFNRNSAYGANSFFNNKAGNERPFRNRNHFGGKLGGPVPEAGNRLFFFSFYEVLRDRVTVPANRTLLLPDARQGIFTYITEVEGQEVIRKTDLLGLHPDITRINPIIDTRILSRMPLSGNRPDLGDKLNTTGITVNQSADTDRDTFTTRIDHNLNDRHAQTFVFTRNKESNRRPDQNNTEGFFIDHPVLQSSTNNQLVIAHRWTKSPRFSTEMRGGFFFSSVPFERTLEVPENFIIPPSIISNPEVTYLNQGRQVRTYNLQNTSILVSKEHALRFGGQMQMFQVDPYSFANTVPAFRIGTNSTTPLLTEADFTDPISRTQLANANSLFALLGGIVSTGNQSFNVKDKFSGFRAVPRRENYRFSDYSLYLEDQWRPARTLTLNLGLRYELVTPVRLLNGLALEPVIPKGSDPLAALMNPAGYYGYVGGNAGGGNKLYRTDWNNLAPILSFAYAPSSRIPLLRHILGTDNDFVIRGGLRQSYVNDSNLTASRFAVAGNSGLGTTAVNAVNPITGDQFLNARPDTLPEILAPALVLPRTYLQNNGPAFSNFGIAFAIDPDIRTTRITEYNLSIQRRLGWGTVLQVRYAGNRSNNLWRGADYNQIEIRGNGFIDDFNRARRNLLNTGNPQTGEPLTVFPLLGNGGSLSDQTVRTNLRNGTPADLAMYYINRGQTGSVRFLPNPGIGVADLLNNGGKHRYDSLQIELTRQFSNTLRFQANYTWQKTLTDAVGTSQTLVDTILDLERPWLEYTRADYDLSHVFNLNWDYALPVGKGRRFALRSWPNLIAGGWQLSGIIRINSGSPITIVDARGTLNRAARSARQTPDSAISAGQIRALTGYFESSDDIYYFDPSILNAEGRATNGYGNGAFPGQVFFNAAPGVTGTLGRGIVDGPGYFNADASLIKTVSLAEGSTLQLRVDAFNVLNRTSFYFANQLQDINSNSFGKLLNEWGPREIQISARLSF